MSSMRKSANWAAPSLKVVEGWPEGAGYKLLSPSSTGYSAIVKEIESIAGVPLSSLKGKFHTVYGSGGYIYALDASNQISLVKSGEGSSPDTFVNTGVAGPIQITKPGSDKPVASSSWAPLVLTGIVLLAIGGAGYYFVLKPKLASKKKASVVVK